MRTLLATENHQRSFFQSKGNGISHFDSIRKIVILEGLYHLVHRHQNPPLELIVGEKKGNNIRLQFNSGLVDLPGRKKALTSCQSK